MDLKKNFQNVDMNELSNHFLIATPKLSDPFFSRSVVYVCEHNDEGSMGIIINLPVHTTVGKVLETVLQTEIKSKELNTEPIYAGGPVHMDHGFILHYPQEGWNSSIQISPEVMLTTSKDILEALGTERGPNQYLVAMGFAGWEPGQLEDEIRDNSWLVAPAQAHILFDTPASERWHKTGESLGIDLYQMTDEIGHA